MPAADVANLRGGVVEDRPAPDRAAPDRPALRRVTALDPADFAATVWGRQASLSRAADLSGAGGTAGVADLLDLDAVDRLLTVHGLRTPFLRVARAGQTLPPARFTRGGGVGATIADQVDDAALTRLFADGSTLVLQALHRTHPPVVDFARALGAELGHPLQVNGYVTPAASQGFSAHYDVHDVFVLQVAGSKRWLVHEPVLAHPRRDQPWNDRRAEVEARAAQPPLLDVVLEPGDALYLPAGFLHAATALGGTTCHLTVGVHPWTRAHLLDAALEALRENEKLREPLPLGIDVGDPAALAGALAATVGALADALPGVSAADVAGRLARRADAATRPAPVRPIAQAETLAALSDSTPLRWRAGLRATLTEEPACEPGQAGGRRLVLATPECTVRLPVEARPGVERLVGGETLRAEELGALGTAQVLDTARVLLRSALVTPAPHSE